MSESKDPIKQHRLAELITVINEIVRYWRELGRKRYDANPPADGRSFEEHWPLFLNLLLLDQAIRWSKALRPLSWNCEN